MASWDLLGPAQRQEHSLLACPQSLLQICLFLGSPHPL